MTLWIILGLIAAFVIGFLVGAVSGSMLTAHAYDQGHTRALWRRK